MLEILIAMIVISIVATGMAALFSSSTQFSRRTENLTFAMGLQAETAEFLGTKVAYQDDTADFSTGNHNQADRSGPRGTNFTTVYNVTNGSSDPREVEITITWDE